MPHDWQELYSNLEGFIAEHPEVEIGASIVKIPNSVRTEFYRLFGAVRTALIEEKFPDLLSEARVLSESYTKVEQDVTELLGLDDVSMVASLHRFLHNPIDQLVRGLFDPLFDLLKMKIGIEKFEEKALQKIEVSFWPLYRLGYEKWVTLSLVKLLEADRLFQVTPRVIDVEETIMGKLKRGEQVPAPEESKRLLFRYSPDDLFAVPDFIIHSARVNRYIAIRSEVGVAPGNAFNASEEREWYPIDPMVAFKPGLIPLYVADNPKEISLVNDAEKICRPDLIMECREQKDWYEKGRLDEVKFHHHNLKPRRGTYIVSREPVSEQGNEVLEEAIHILTVGFDQTKLEPIISALMNECQGLHNES